MIFGERPEARLLDIHFAKTIQSVLVKHASDASAPELWHHVQRLQNAVAHRDHSDGLVVERNTRLPIWVGECGDPVRANRVTGVLTEVCWEDVLEARDRRSARDPETQLGVLHRRAHDSHVRRSTAVGSRKQHKVSPGRAFANAPRTSFAPTGGCSAIPRGVSVLAGTRLRNLSRGGCVMSGGKVVRGYGHER